MKKVLFFTDPGIDDAIALMYALLHPDIELVGIVSSYGNISKKEATRNIAFILHTAGRSDIPLIGGATRPFDGLPPTYYPEIHGPKGLGPLIPPDFINGELLNFSRVFDIMKEHPDLTIVDVGRSTSLATAMILSSKEVSEVKEFYIMGGAFLTPGNVTEYAEANFFGDPLATNLVLTSLKNVHIMPLNITNTAIVTMDMVEYILQHAQNKLVHLLKPLMNFYCEVYAELVPGLQGAPIHDVTAMAMLTYPSLGKFLSRDVDVQTFGMTKGQSVADLRPKAPPSKNNINIYLKMDYQKFIKDFIHTMIGPNLK
ncbi:nucleoside hydrolase [Falsibacillus albus]|uniref:Nucleoside hydrolase n=1 Tax=Falsibacillus albus TaxID=2478915 RepID=A0A3L7JSD7_9BACI|nr:nucleoside hydrolase [Falsibacillus albus]RLQ93768.1 nucleoside hydrolase [Falsibacillus albus]